MFSPARTVPALFVMLWATGFIGARYAMPWAEPFTFLSARFVLTMLILVPLALLWKSKAMDRRQAAHAMVAGALMHGVYLGGVFWAIDHGMPAGLSALIIGLQPLITALMAGWFLGEAMLPRHWAGLAVGFAGVMMVLWPKLGAMHDAVHPKRGRFPGHQNQITRLALRHDFEQRGQISATGPGSRHGIAIELLEFICQPVEVVDGFHWSDRRR